MQHWLHSRCLVLASCLGAPSFSCLVSFCCTCLPAACSLQDRCDSDSCWASLKCPRLSPAHRKPKLDSVVFWVGTLGRKWVGTGSELWVETGSELDRNWVGTGSELGRHWVGTLGRNSGSELGPNWVGTGSELGRNWVGTVGRNSG